MAAPLSCRVLAITPIFARKLFVSSLSPRICPRIEHSNKIKDHRIRLSSGVVPTRLYSSSSQAAYDETQDDILYKKLLIEVKGHDPTVIDSYEKFVTMAARELDVNIAEIKTPPKVIERYTQLKSVHIYKKHRVQYETRTHFRSLTVKHITGSTTDTFLEYIQRNLPEGMAMKVTKHRIEQIPAHITPPPQESTI